jgi:DNA topoisomerase I
MAGVPRVRGRRSLREILDLPSDPLESAEQAGLVYINDRRTGIRRRRAGRGFSYVGVDGRVIRDRAQVERIRALAIPPAWTEVWISPTRRGHIQATGRDARGRKQYRYHPRWREVRDEVKYGRMLAFAAALPAIRAATESDLRRPGLPREKVLALVVRLLEATLIRVGNDEYARDNRSYGLTTMRNRHAAVDGSTVNFRFRGKSGKEFVVPVDDRRLAGLVKRCQELPGQDLFEYTDADGVVQGITSTDVNAYLRQASGDDFTAKDFRTWAGTVAAALALREFELVDSQAQAKQNVVEAVRRVAEQLGNTPAVSRAGYVHPAVIDAYLDGTMVDALQQRAVDARVEGSAALRPEEAAVLGLLRARLAREDRDRPSAA